MTVQKFLFLFHNTVYLFVKSKEFLGVNHVFSSTTATPLAESSNSLALICTGSQSVLKVVPIIFLFLLQLLLVAQHSILLLCWCLCLCRLLLRCLLLCGDDVLPLRPLFFLWLCAVGGGGILLDLGRRLLLILCNRR